MTLAEDIRAYAQEVFRRVQLFRLQAHPGQQAHFPPAETVEEQVIVQALYDLENYARALRMDMDPEGKVPWNVYQSLTGSVTLDAVLPVGQKPPDPAS